MAQRKKAGFPRERYFWIVLCVTLLTLIFVLSLQYIRYRDRFQQAHNEKEVLLGKIEAMKGGSSLLSSDIARIKEKGLSKPVEDLTADLMQHGELIPFKGVLGGTMAFYSKKDIHVLTSRWVLAFFEDGHIGGRMLLEYEVSPEGKIRWKVLSAYLD